MGQLWGSCGAVVGPGCHFRGTWGALVGQLWGSCGAGGHLEFGFAADVQLEALLQRPQNGHRPRVDVDAVRCAGNTREHTWDTRGGHAGHVEDTHGTCGGHVGHVEDIWNTWRTHMEHVEDIWDMWKRYGTRGGHTEHVEDIWNTR